MLKGLVIQNKLGDFAQRSAYPIDKVIARFRGKDNVSVIKPTDAKVPLGLRNPFVRGNYRRK